MADPLVALRDVRCRYPTSDDDVLRGVDLTLRRGEFVGLAGSTGAGKTTLCQTLNGLMPHYTGGQLTGTVTVDGRDTADAAVADLSARVGLVFQDADAQLVMSTVEEECLLGPLSQGAGRGEARQRARDMLSRLEVLELAERSPQTLSGGQKQRVAIAAVMVTGPAVLVLDEATSELDAVMVEKIFRLCQELNSQLHTTILLVSHEMELLARHAQRLVLVDGGRIVLDAPTREALQQRDVFARAGVRLPQVTEYALALDSRLSWPELPLTEADALPALRRALAASSRPHDAAASDPGEMTTMAASALSAPPRDAARPLIHIDGVRFAYREPVTVLDDITLTFEAGEFTAIIGNNGSGKSTLMKLILGLVKPRAGRVVIDGEDTLHARVSALARRIGFIFQDPNDQLFARSVAGEIRFGLDNLGLPADEIDERLEETLARFDLTDMRTAFPRFLARGDRQKVCIASVVAMRPQILLLDEPTTGQDHRDSRQILDLAQDLNARGITILLVTHDLANVARSARRVVTVSDGKVRADGPTADIMTDEPLLASCHLTPPQSVRLSLALTAEGIRPAMTPEALAEQTLARITAQDLAPGGRSR